MAMRRFRPEEIVAKLRQAETGGVSAAQVTSIEEETMLTTAE